MVKEFQWLEVSFICSKELAEALAEVLGRFVSNGVVIEDITQYDVKEHENFPTGNVRISGYLPLNSETENVQGKIEEAVWHLSQILPVPDPEYSYIPDENWMQAWKKNYRPIKIGKSFLVLPAWTNEVNNPDRIMIKINPSMAFGTGIHPSTQVCLIAIENHLSPQKTVIDLGCGSGILTIAALKKKAPHVLAVDIDPLSTKATQENLIINNIEKGFEIGQGSLENIKNKHYSIQKADFVLVNILAPVIIKMLTQGLQSIMSHNGKLVLAGLLLDQEQDVMTVAINARLTLIDRYEEDDWVALVFQNSDLIPET